jgi:adenylate cyclase
MDILTLAWEFMAVWINVYDHLTVHSSLAIGPAEEYSFFSNLPLNCGGALIGALIGGSFLIFYVNTRLADKSYGYTIFIVTITDDHHAHP